MREASLQAIMSEIVQRLDAHDTLQARGAAPQEKLSGLPGQIQTYLSLDPLLAELFKRYLDARASRDRLVAKHGHDAPMTEMAADMVDSAHCALETRLIEVRALYKLREERDVAGERVMIAAAQSQRFEQKMQRHNDRNMAMRARRDAEKGYFYILMILFFLQNMLEQTRKNLSLASSFSGASAMPVRAAA